MLVIQLKVKEKKFNLIRNQRNEYFDDTLIYSSSGQNLKIDSICGCHWAPLTIQMVKNLPATQETQVRSLDWEDPLEKGMANQSSILAWRIPWTEEPGGLQSIESQRVGHG